MDKKTVIFPASGGEAYVHSAEADGLIPAGTLSVMFFDKEEGVSKELSVSISGASSDLVCELGWIKVILKDAADKHPDRVEISVRPNDTKERRDASILLYQWLDSKYSSYATASIIVEQEAE